MPETLKTSTPIGLRPRLQRRGGFTVLELLVTVGVVAVLVGLLLPAVLRARESARRITCANQLRQVGLALHQHHNWRQQLPAAWRVAKHSPEFAYGWAAALLPGLEEDSVLARIDLDRAPLGSSDDYLLGRLLCPSDLTESRFRLDAETEANGSDALPTDPLATLPTSNYVGVYGTVEADEFYERLLAGENERGDGPIVFDRRVNFTDLRRGLAHTIAVGERTMATVPSTWLGVHLGGEDAECRLVGSAMTRPNCETCDECEFTSRHAGGAYFLWADGRVELVGDDVETTLYRQLAQRSSEE